MEISCRFFYFYKIIMTMYAMLHVLNWNSYIEKVSNKMRKIIGIMNELKYILPQNILLTLYNALIGPHLNYCILAWGFDSKRLHKLQ